MGRCRRDKVHLTVAQRENFEQISGGGFITEYANRHNTLIVILYGKLLTITPFERNIAILGAMRYNRKQIDK